MYISKMLLAIISGVLFVVGLAGSFNLGLNVKYNDKDTKFLEGFFAAMIVFGSLISILFFTAD